jgi:hypothetical protein
VEREGLFVSSYPSNPPLRFNKEAAMSEDKHYQEPEIRAKDDPRDPPPNGGETTPPNPVALVDPPTRGDDDEK